MAVAPSKDEQYDATVVRATTVLEIKARAQATAPLSAELAGVSAAVVGAQLRGSSGNQLLALLDAALARISVSVRPVLDTLADAGRSRGRDLAAGFLARQKRTHPVGRNPAVEALDDAALLQVIESSDGRVRDRFGEAIALAGTMLRHLENPTPDDVMAPLAKARSATLLVETDVAWVAHRSVSLGQAESASYQRWNVVWIAERNACPHCLAYQGHVVHAGQAFPAGLTYGDHPLKAYGRLIAPPLHPHCRCQVRPTEIAAGDVDRDLVREAARSVARGLSDHQSEVGKLRSADRLVRGVTTPAAGVKLPKSVMERAQRNVADRKFRARPGSPAATAMIKDRHRGRTADGK